MIPPPPPFSPQQDLSLMMVNINVNVNVNVNSKQQQQQQQQYSSERTILGFSATATTAIRYCSIHQVSDSSSVAKANNNTKRKITKVSAANVNANAIANGTANANANTNAATNNTAPLFGFL